MTRNSSARTTYTLDEVAEMFGINLQPMRERNVKVMQRFTRRFGHKPSMPEDRCSYCRGTFGLHVVKNQVICQDCCMNLYPITPLDDVQK